jgi:DNA-binding transcriptional LysR family regulator
MADELVMRPLPFEVPPVHVEALWARRRDRDAAHQWLRSSVLRAAEAVQEFKNESD